MTRKLLIGQQDNHSTTCASLAEPIKQAPKRDDEKTFKLAVFLSIKTYFSRSVFCWRDYVGLHQIQLIECKKDFQSLTTWNEYVRVQKKWPKSTSHPKKDRTRKWCHFWVPARSTPEYTSLTYLISNRNHNHPPSIPLSSTSQNDYLVSILSLIAFQTLIILPTQLFLNLHAPRRRGWFLVTFAPTGTLSHKNMFNAHRWAHSVS